jgi:hypothetical protein
VVGRQHQQQRIVALARRSARGHAASATAGAVLRPMGSSTIACGVTPTWRSCSAIMKRCSSLHTTMGAPSDGRPATRSAVSCTIVRSPTSGRNCLG